MEQINYIEVKDIAEKIGTPFYLMHPDKYRKNISAFISAFHKRYSRIIAGYSMKTNFVPALCDIAKAMGCYAEVVSEMELDFAIKLGFKNIIFNGPIKTESALLKAISYCAIINLDSEYEVDYMCKYKTDNPATELKVGLRVNVHLTDEKGNSTVQCGLREGRFGFAHDILSDSINRLRNAGIKIFSLHGHTSSSDRAIGLLQTICFPSAKNLDWMICNILILVVVFLGQHRKDWI